MTVNADRRYIADEILMSIQMAAPFSDSSRSGSHPRQTG